MHKLLLLVALLPLSFPAFGIYKCGSGNQVTYSDAPCADGKELDIRNNPADDAAEKARQQLARDKKELTRMENQRHKQEAKDEKAHRQLARRASAKQKKCADLALRKKWRDEDVMQTSGKANEKAKVLARRAKEKLELECGN